MKQRSKPTQTRTKQSNPRTMLTIAVIAILAVIAAGLIWNTTQSRSTDVAASSGTQSVALGSPQTAAQQRISPAQYQSTFVQPKQAHLLVDVRTPEEFAGGHIPGAVNISLQSLPQRMQELPQDQPIVLYCRSGNRSNVAAQMLVKAGYKDVYDLGGINAWSTQGLPVQ